jgi:hypothetical protein
MTALRYSLQPQSETVEVTRVPCVNGVQSRVAFVGCLNRERLEISSPPLCAESRPDSGRANRLGTLVANIDKKLGTFALA